MRFVSKLCFGRRGVCLVLVSFCLVLMVLRAFEMDQSDRLPITLLVLSIPAAHGGKFSFLSREALLA